ncbi:unnamed protein product [Rangifer tarandus platyrhynchus]|uniref:Uncharacterized protein n=2 Tax=Rangifer tarandus platyrhynchus TaxID=3082113 RepID=A0AC60A269_RANTA|nr:unnamed protein product [Rangifer tarandus platyrhynchus]
MVAVLELLTAAASLLRAQALGAWASEVVALRLRSSGTRAWLPHSMWNLPGPGIKPVSSALVDRFSSTAPPGKSPASFSSCHAAPSSTFIISSFKVCNNLLSSLQPIFTEYHFWCLSGFSTTSYCWPEFQSLPEQQLSVFSER